MSGLRSNKNTNEMMTDEDQQLKEAIRVRNQIKDTLILNLKQLTHRLENIGPIECEVMGQKHTFVCLRPETAQLTVNALRAAIRMTDEGLR